MASNEYVIPEHYEDLTPAPQLDQKTLNKMAWRSCFLQASFNYERMQAAGWLYSIIPGLEKIHTNKNDLAASMSHNLEFFNTHPFLVTFVMGIVLSLEQNKVDIPTIRAVRVAAMGPLGGIGDALFWLTLVPITAGITSNMAINGNAAAPIIFLVIFNVVQFALRFWLMNWSYKLGTSAIDALTANMQAFTRAASIMGVFVVGCLVVTMGGTQINLQIPNGTTRGLAPTTVIVSEKEAENFTGMEGIDTETAEAGTIAMTDEDGNATDVYIFQNDRLIDKLEDVGTFNTADAEQTDEDKEIFVNQQKKIAAFNAYVKKNAIATVGISKPEHSEEAAPPPPLELPPMESEQEMEVTYHISDPLADL